VQAQTSQASQANGGQPHSGHDNPPARGPELLHAARNKGGSGQAPSEAASHEKPHDKLHDKAQEKVHELGEKLRQQVGAQVDTVEKKISAGLDRAVNAVPDETLDALANLWSALRSAGSCAASGVKSYAQSWGVQKSMRTAGKAGRIALRAAKRRPMLAGGVVVLSVVGISWLARNRGKTVAAKSGN